MSKNSFRETEDGGDFCFEELLSSLRDCIWWKMHFFNNTLSKEEFNLETFCQLMTGHLLTYPKLSITEETG